MLQIVHVHVHAVEEVVGLRAASEGASHAHPILGKRLSIAIARVHH